MRKGFLILLSAIILLTLFPSKIFAFGIFTSGQTGYDISSPQGNISSLPSPYGFVIIGVTNGRAYTTNSYLATQLLLAQNKILSLYMNLNAPVGSTVRGNTSSPKNCGKDRVCQAYNYGFNAAASAYSYAQKTEANSSMWWLDIETGNSWSPNLAINDATIQGAVDYLSPKATVGIYSTRAMWNTIAGSSFVSVVPNWGPGNCSQPFTINGQMWLTQSSSGGLDVDYACP